MKKCVLAVVFLLYAAAVAMAAEEGKLSPDGTSDQLLRERIIRAIKDHVILKQEVLNGKIPVKIIVNTSQDDAELKKLIEDTLSKELGNFGDVSIVPEDEQAWLWVSVAATTGDIISMSCAYGKYENSTLWKRDEEINILSERKFFINHFVGLMAKNNMEEQISILTDSINTWLLEPAREDRGEYLRFQGISE